MRSRQNALKRLINSSKSPEPLTVWRKRQRIRAYIYSVRGQRKYNLNQYDDAVADFDKAIKLYPEKADAYYNRGLAKFRLGDIQGINGNVEEARRSMKQALRTVRRRLSSIQRILMHTITVPVGSSGSVNLRQSGRCGEGATVLSRCDSRLDASYHPSIQNLRNPYNNRGIAKATLGESKIEQGDIADAQGLYVEAIQDCTQAIRLNPRDAEPYINRGYAAVPTR